MDYEFIDFAPVFDDDYVRPKKAEISVDQHLSSPIRPDLLILIEDALKIHPSEVYKPGVSTTKLSYVKLPNVAIMNKRMLLSIFDSAHDLLSKLSIDASYIYGDLLKLGYGEGTKESRWLRSHFPNVHCIIKEYISSFNPDLLAEFQEPWDTLNNTEIKTYTSKIYWEDLKQTMVDKANKNIMTWSLRYTSSKKYPFMLVNKSIGLLIECDEIVIKQGDFNEQKKSKLFPIIKKLYMMNYEQILMISDAITNRFFTLYFSRLINPKFQFKCDPSVIIKLYNIGDRYFEKHGNEVYAQIKMFESLCHSIIINKVDKIEISSVYKDFIQTEIKENNYLLLAEMTNFLYELNEYQLVECFGLYRHWGHSFVEEEEGCIKVQNIAKTRPLPQQKTIQLIKGCLLRQFCHSYIIKHGRWPNLDVSLLSGKSKLRLFIEKSITNINFENAELTLQDWSLVQVKQEFQFDFASDFTTLLSDKSIAPYQNENNKTYDYRMTGISNLPPKTTTKRVLTEVLNRPTLEVKSICKRIMNRQVPDEWKIVKLSSKERELNVKPRLFAMMVLEMRLYFCVTEENLSKKIFQYYPQQSMTSSEAKLAYRLQQVGSINKGCYAEILVGIDFKSWNLHWSYTTTSPFFKILDALYGTPGLFDYTHEFFQTSQISLSSAFRIPNMYFDQKKPRHQRDDHYFWTNHLGGFEGLRQKGWTWITIGLLLLVESMTGIKSSIIGQGDNQICKIKIKVPDRDYGNMDDLIYQNILLIREQVNIFLTTLTDVSKNIGLVVKPLETWVSHKVLVYGKEFLINGAFCSQTLKRISRTMADVNELYPTIQNKIATMQTSGLTTAQKTFLIAIPYYVCQLESLLTFIRDTERLKCLSSNAESLRMVTRLSNWVQSKQSLRFVQLTNSDCFGVPFSHIIDYYYRGHPDQLTGYTTLLTIISQADNELGKMAARLLHWFTDRQYSLGDGSPELLVTNPTSTNIYRIDPVSKYFKGYVKNYIVNVCKNKDIKNMFNTSSTQFDKDLYAYLLKFQPIFPRVLHEIAANTPTGARLAFMSQFSSTRTLQSMSDIKQGKSLSELMGSSDYELINHLYNTYSKVMCKSSKFVCACPTLLAQDMRDYSWAIITGNREIEGVTVPHPLHLTEVIHGDAMDTRSKEYFSILSPEIVTLDSLYKPGTAGMYVGNKTQEKRTGRILVVENHCKPLESAFRLNQIKTWCINESSKAYDYINYLISLRTSIPETTIQLAGGEIEKGTFYHRLNDHVTKMSSLNNMRHTLTTHFVFSSDNLTFTSRGGDDYNVHIQGIILLAFRLKLIEIVTNNEAEKYTKLNIVNKCCIKEITNDKLINNEQGPTASVIDTTNKLLYADNSSIDELTQPTGVMVKMMNYSSPPIAMASYLLSKLHSVISVQTWTSDDNKVIGVSAIGVTELMQTSIVDICKELAYLLLIYYESFDSLLIPHIMSLPSSFWGGISDNALLPDVLHKVLDQLTTDGVADMYASEAKISGRLNQLLAKHVSVLISVYHNNRKIERKNPLFFLTPGTTMKKIVLMWNCSNLLRGIYDVKSYNSIKSIIKEFPPGNHLSQVQLKKLYVSVTNILGNDKTNNLLLNNPILILRKAPELYFRTKEVIPIGRQVSGFPTHSIPNSTLDVVKYNPYAKVCYLGDCVSNSVGTEIIDTSLYYAQANYDDNILRRRYDHAYRLYDTISTAHSKITQIIIKESMTLDQTCVCTADGEASISYAIYKLSGKPVIYNSLYDPKNIVPQRFEHYVPGSFLLDRSGIIGAKLCLVYGGDLNDDNYLQKFLSILPDKTPLLTNDAEVSGHFHPEVEQKMHISMLKIIHKCHPTNFVKKSYIHNLKLLSLHIASYSLYYESVKIVVPTYSSSEGKEVYIVCRTLRACLPSLQYVENSNLLVPTNHLGFYTRVSEFAKARQEAQPFQDSQGRLTAYLMKIASLMGFKNNYTESFNRFLMWSDTNLSVLTIDEKMLEIERHLIKNLEDLVIGTSSAYLGERVTSMQATAIAESKKTHFEFDKIAIRALHISILRETMNISDQSEAYTKLMKKLIEPIQLIYNGKTVYKYRVNNLQKWSTEYLKHYWKIWGHKHRSITKISSS